MFMKAFDHISKGIDEIYKELTKSLTHPLGGTAYLNLENEDEPFLHGIKYTAMPPTKRFRDIEQLSGGEKTVANWLCFLPFKGKMFQEICYQIP